MNINWEKYFAEFAGYTDNERPDRQDFQIGRMYSAKLKNGDRFAFTVKEYICGVLYKVDTHYQLGTGTNLENLIANSFLGCSSDLVNKEWLERNYPMKNNSEIWLVWKKGDRGPVFEHPSYACARTEASRLCAQLGGTFYVCKAFAKCEAPAPVWTDLTEEIPV